MSNKVTTACRAVRLPPTQKSALMCLADYCHDDGRDWHSIAAIVEWTCLSRRAVIVALKALEGAGIIEVERASGRNSSTRVSLDRVEALGKAPPDPNQCTTCTGAADAPVQDVHPTRARGARDPCTWCT